MDLHIGNIYTITALVSALLTGVVYNRMKLTLHTQAIEGSFVYMLRFIILFNLVDALWGLCYAGAIRSPEFFALVGYGYHTLSAISAFLWMLYVLQFAKHNVHVYRATMGAAYMLLLAQLAIIASNPFHHLLFEIGENNEYLMHGLRPLVYGLQFAYYCIILLSSGLLSQSDGEEYREQHKAAFVYSLVPALFCVGQYAMFNVAMYSLGFAFVALVICLYRQSSRIEKLRQEQVRNMSHQQLSIIRSLADNCLVIYYVDLKTGQYDRFVRADTPLGLEIEHLRDKDFFHEAAEWGRSHVAEADLEQFLIIMDRDNIVRTFAQQAEISMVLRLKQGDNLVYHEGRITRPRDEVDPDKIIVVVYDIDARYRAQLKQNEELARVIDQKTALEKEASLLDLAAHRDFMTGLFNRRAFEDHLQAMGDRPDSEDFVFVSMDVNGLKAVNDDMGHDAGDELIKGSALCMKQCFDNFGKVYRHGGDEFSAILHVGSDTLESLFTRFEQVVSEWRGKLVNSLAVSFGYATAKEAPEASIGELAKLADQRMYEYKVRYYAQKGIDRRAQLDAYDALRESYTKVLKVDLLNDTFVIIKIDERELDSREGFSEKFSEWVYFFAKSGHVHETDMLEYLQKTRLEYIRKFFAQPNSNLSFRYKRKTEEGFRETMLEIIPARDYAPDNQIVFLYVKKVGGEGLYMRLLELEDNMELSVQMLWDHNLLEFQTSLVKKDEHGLYIRPYLRDGHAIKFDVLATDSIQCNLFATTTGGGSVMWHDVELKSVEEPEGVLYLVSTRDFNQYSRPGDRRFHGRTASTVQAQVSDMSFNTVEVALYDISDSGISFYATNPIQLESDVINISFTDTIKGESFTLHCTAKVVRSYTDDGKSFYGCLIINPSRDYRLYVFMHKLGAGEN